MQMVVLDLWKLSVDEPTALSQQVNLVPSIYSQYNIACKGKIMAG